MYTRVVSTLIVCGMKNTGYERIIYRKRGRLPLCLMEFTSSLKRVGALAKKFPLKITSIKMFRNDASLEILNFPVKPISGNSSTLP